MIVDKDGTRCSSSTLRGSMMTGCRRLPLAVFASRPKVPENHLVVALGKIIKPSYLVPPMKVKPDEKSNERRAFCLKYGKLDCQEHSAR